MIKIIKSSYPYYVMQDDTMIDQYCVMIKSGAGFSQQISKWYFRKGNAINKYNKILQERTQKILEHNCLWLDSMQEEKSFLHAIVTINNHINK